MTRASVRRFVGLWVAFAGFTVLVAGCGDSRRRHPVSGAVTYQGKPVEMGSIRFEADASVGNFAPVSSAPITNGKYATKPEDSPTDGTYRVMVMGIDVPNIKKDGPPGTPWEMPALFPPYTTTVQIPPAGGTFDVTIPAPANKK